MTTPRRKTARFLLASLLVVEIFVLGFYLGKTDQLRASIEHNENCKEEAFRKKINMDEFYGFKLKGLSLQSIFIHAQAAVAYKYQACSNQD